MHKSSDASDLDMTKKNHKALPSREQRSYREKRTQAPQAEAAEAHGEGLILYPNVLKKGKEMLTCSVVLPCTAKS